MEEISFLIPKQIFAMLTLRMESTLNRIWINGMKKIPSSVQMDKYKEYKEIDKKETFLKLVVRCR